MLRLEAADQQFTSIFDSTLAFDAYQTCEFRGKRQPPPVTCHFCGFDIVLRGV